MIGAAFISLLSPLSSALLLAVHYNAACATSGPRITRSVIVQQGLTEAFQGREER